MATIQQFSQRFTRIASSKALNLILFVEIKKAEKHFIEAQKLQLSFGKNNKDEIIGTYSQATENMSRGVATKKPKIAGEPFNFEYYGDFFDDMVLDVFTDKASFYSEDSKTEELIKKYEGLFGLTDDNLKEVIQTYIVPAFQKQIRTELNLI